MKNKYIIRPREASDFNDFVELRSKVFGDDKDFINFFDKCFRDNYIDFLILEEQDDKNVLKAALTQFDMGRLIVPDNKDSEIAGKSIEMSYAICTDPAARGKGYGSHITVYAREIAESSRKLSMLSPAEPNLIDFYEPLEYKKFMYAEQAVVKFTDREIFNTFNGISSNSHDNDGISNAFYGNNSRSVCSICNNFDVTSLCIDSIAAEKYNEYREYILKDRTHIKLSQGALQFASSSTIDGKGMLLISDSTRAEPLGIASCSVSEKPDSLDISELLTFNEAGGDLNLGLFLCKALAMRYRKHICEYMMPSDKYSKTATVLGLISAKSDDITALYDSSLNKYPPYMGFTFG
ncbi:GNAT family protein [Mogibacterium pumilum]|uniref:N-acetyltransferase domain-containing protein n=1 Tax=Mogibacterium pumilum TaxID=86332 RepID=A0A223AQI1_9FIRM|nr:hypothetical protein [Mogibacterium pumilum]ASS37197.1 hypothetical protein AXF17_01055 [Mogibacterium pumilum]